MPHDWRKIRAQVAEADGAVVLTDQPYSTAEALRQGKITVMRDVLVATRNNHRVQGRRRCDIYLTEGGS